MLPTRLLSGFTERIKGLKYLPTINQRHYPLRGLCRDYEPYYQDEYVTIYNGDCMEILPSLTPIDCIITDPPYGIDFKYDEYKDNPKLHKDRITEWMTMFRKLSKKIALTPGILQMWDYPKPDWVLCWRKTFSVSRSLFGANNWEPVLYYGKGGRNGRQSDFFEATFMNDKQAAQHPCPKPVKWAKWLMITIAKKEEYVFDPFMGSGTTLLAAKQLGRKAVGIELSKKYCDIAIQRLSQTQLDL